jgi:SAM-dependent methyltransferase
MPSALQRTVNEFTRQADGFAEAPQIQDDAALRLVYELSAAGTEDTVLDVACGPGVLTCALAERVRHATGIDVTPAMIDRAKRLQADKQLANVEWRVGEAAPLPWPDATFSLVVCRYAFHHFHDPERVLGEMRRVCRPGGRVCVIDVALHGGPPQVEAFNRMERLRDPSHVRAFPLEELCGLFADAGLPVSNCAHYRLEFELNALLNGSFPVDGGEPVIRGMFEESLSTDSMGLKPTLTNGEIRCSYPISVVVSHTSANY